tara:strand:+ start:29241 stop:29444 length:204 start_codon:yes stop_codon:yes gene_type:complete
MDNNKIYSEIFEKLSETLKDSDFTILNTFKTFDTVDLSPTILIMEKTDSGERIRFKVKISDVAEINK